MTHALMQELYSWLDMKRTPRLEGWCSWDKAIALMSTTWALRPAVCVEIGVWAGRSALPVALALRENGHGVLHCIDPYQPAASAEGYDTANADWWTNVANHQYAKNQLDDLVNKAGLFRSVRIHARKSDDVQPPDMIDLLHIDGQHTAQAKRDVERFASRVRVGGIVFMDDVSWANSGVGHVRGAVDALASMGFQKLYGIYGKGADGIVSDCEALQRVK